MAFTRIINIFANAGMYFVAPLVGTSLDGAPSLAAALYTMLIGMILSASREGLDYVRQQERKKRPD